MGGSGQRVVVGNQVYQFGKLFKNQRQRKSSLT